MTSSVRPLLSALMLLCGLVLAARSPAAPAEAPRQVLARAVASHPDDPDLAWAWIRTLLAEGERKEALARVAAFRERWPARRPEAERLHGRLLHEAGRHAEALAMLTAVVERHPADGIARFHRGLVLRDLGRRDEAVRDLAMAAELEPRLAADSLVLRALDRLAEGDEPASRRLLERADALDPAHPLAAQARRVLSPARGARRSRLELSAYGGLAFDSNVTLDSGLDLPGFSRDRDDVRGVWGAGFVAHPLLRDRVRLGVGYRYDQSGHRDLDAYDLRSHSTFASFLLRTGERSAFRLDGSFSALELDDERYRRMETLQPNFFFSPGSDWGVLRTFARFERRRYHERPWLSSLERDGVGFGAGLEHTLAIRARDGAWVALGARFDRTLTNAERDLFGLGGAFDHDRWQGRLRLQLPLLWGIDSLGSVSLARERYHHRNVIDFLTDDGVGTPAPEERRDTIIEGRLGFTRAVARHLSLELTWRGMRRFSNVDLYDYDRHVVGLTVRAAMQ